MASSLPVLLPRMLLGLQTHVKGNALYLSDDEIIYPVGGVLCLHNLAQKKQKFIKFPEKGVNVSMMAISNNRKYVAVAESGEKISISIYDPLTCKKKKQMFLPLEKDLVAKEWVAITFTNDSKCVVAVTGDPDWTMYVFKSEKGKLDTFCRANNTNNTGTVVQIACNPNDPNLIVLVGQALYRNLACSENSWRQFGFGKAENMNLTCAAWISQDRLLAGTNNGKILYLENAELKMIFTASDLNLISFKTKDDDQAQGSAQNLLDTDITNYGDEEYEVTRIVSFNKGFVFSYMPGTIHYYEKESAHKYKKKCIFKIPDHNIGRGEEEKNEDYEDYSDMVFNEVNTISANISEERIVVSCNETQLYTVRLWAPDTNAITETMMVELNLPLHHGAIGALAVCQWKPIFMTTGIWDRTVRIWNYETEVLEIMKKYMDDVFCCDLHPTGLFCVVGFSDKIRYMKILIDDLQLTREYPVRACKLCKFSNLGHLFAVANANVIQIYSSITFEHMFNLKGHNGLVTGLAWAHDDYKLASCGTEGAVYEWQISTTRRICETIIKICHFTDVSVTGDGKSNFGVGSDGIVREIINSNIYAEVAITPTGLDAVALSNSDNMIFATGNNGSIFSIQVPFTDGSPVFNEYVLHSTTCNSIKISYDDRYLISTSTSCICVWRITNAETKQIKLDKEFAASTEVMIGRADLVEKLAMIKELQVRMNELQTEHAYQMRQNEAAHATAIKEIHENYGAAIEELKEKNENLEQEHAQEISNITLEISKTKTAHEVFVQKLEANYNEKLIVEYDKFMQLEEKMAQMRSWYDKELEDLTEAKRVSEETITMEFSQQLAEKKLVLDELVEKLNEVNKEHETLVRQIEDDADREIYEMKNQFEKELREEQDLNVKLRGETQASKKKLQFSQKQIEDLNHTVHTHEIEQHKLKTVIFGLEASIGDLRKEILERDSTIQDKEKRISELKQKNQELEKFKFILEFKIDELKAQIEPRDRTIREQTEQINDMVNELENLQKIILSLELQLTELRQKLKATDNEVKREIVKNRAAKSNLKRIKTEIHAASGYVQEVPKLQKCVRDMFHKYNADKDFEVVHAEDTEAKQEFLRQRDFLERTVKALKKQVVKAQTYTGENLRLVEQNSALITETNNLRRNLKVERYDNKRMNALLGLNKAVSNYSEGQRKLDLAMATRDEIRNELRGQLEKDQECIALLKDENERLHAKARDENEDKAKLDKLNFK